MSALLYTCNRYSRENTSNYILSIQLSLDGLSFSIRDYLSNCYIHFEHVPLKSRTFQLEEIRDEIDRYIPDEKPFKKVYVLIEEPEYTVVPARFSTDKSISEFYKLNYSLHKAKELLSSKNKTLGPTFVYPVNRELLAYLHTSFDSISIKHVAEINFWKSKLYYKGDHGIVIMHIFKKHFYLTVSHKQQLLLSNTFEYTYENDLLFFTLNAFSKLDLDQNQTKVYISGNMKRDAVLIKEMLRFVKHVDFEEWPEAYNYSDELYKMPPFYYSTLLIAPLCE